LRTWYAHCVVCPRVNVNTSVSPSTVNRTAQTLRCHAVQQTRLDTGRIRAARRVIDPVFLDTPLYRCEALEAALGCTVSIKLETANPVRSFKARGTELVTSLLAGTGSRAVVCASAGNLGQALAWSGRGRGLDVTVVASRLAPAAKLDRIRALDARLELVDGDPRRPSALRWPTRRHHRVRQQRRRRRLSPLDRRGTHPHLMTFDGFDVKA
jgi:threonine dehydratase